MKKLFTLLALILCCNADSFSQQVDSITRVNIDYIKKQLSITEAKAKQVLAIQQNYKASAKKVLGDSSVSEEVKKNKFQALIDDKNQKLKAILTEEQIKIIVPTTELEKK